jgi:hypothetical protein
MIVAKDIVSPCILPNKATQMVWTASPFRQL